MLCPHCHTGNLLRGLDEHGAHLFCLCCGFYKDSTPYIGACSTHYAQIDKGYDTWTMRQINRIYPNSGEVHHV